MFADEVMEITCEPASCVTSSSMRGMMRPAPRVDYGRFVPVCVYFAPQDRDISPFHTPSDLKIVAKHVGIVSVNYEGTALCYRSICIEAAL